MRKSPLIELVTKLRFERCSALTYSVHLNVLTVIIYVLMNRFYLYIYCTHFIYTRMTQGVLEFVSVYFTQEIHGNLSCINEN